MEINLIDKDRLIQICENTIELIDKGEIDKVEIEEEETFTVKFANQYMIEVLKNCEPIVLKFPE